MKISDIRASLQRLAERLDNQWAYARSDAEMDIAAGRAEYNDDVSVEDAAQMKF